LLGYVISESSPAHAADGFDGRFARETVRRDPVRAA
jgi:hypothetical protein